MNDSPVLTLKEVAAYLSVHVSSMYRAIREGTAPPHWKMGSDYRFNRESVEKWRFEQEHGKAPDPNQKGVKP